MNADTRTTAIADAERKAIEDAFAAEQRASKRGECRHPAID